METSNPKLWNKVGECKICAAPIYLRNWDETHDEAPPEATFTCHCPRYSAPVIQSPPYPYPPPSPYSPYPGPYTPRTA